MRITPKLRKAINAGVRSLCGPNPLAEIGYREAEDGRRVANALLWKENNDLWDVRRLADTKEIEDVPGMPGCATLDLYVTSGIGIDRELETNVYVTIKAGELADIHKQDLRANARTLAILGVPFSKE